MLAGGCVLTRAGKDLAFGKKRQQHVLILASGEKVRHITIRPWLAATALCVAGLLSIGYIGSTAYLILRDDLVGATIARQSRMQTEYEDRIAALRAQVDRVTSKQVLDQQAVERKVEKLLAQQSALTSRHGRMSELLERAEKSGLSKPVIEPSAANAYAPDKKASLSGAVRAIDSALSSPSTGMKGSIGYTSGHEKLSQRNLSLMIASLDKVESEQLSRIASLTSGAASKADAMADIIRRTGIRIDDSVPQDIGGPFVEPVNTSSATFEEQLSNLDSALIRLETVRGAAVSLPFGNPAPGREISSRFGNRIDPFLGRLALHAGIDFVAETGASVQTTGAGTVTSAGFSGGYGNMVEVDHGNGITTRYGHLSEILVKEGDKVALGEVIGKAGSTGRSTGPHVHYEVRLNDNPVDPARFLLAGTELKTYLQ
ncbi:M23 family metallopeptidase [Rhizobium sp. CFBP 13717]|nr:M23 family metallopeptidase [Rhizobium sp. CFBP 13644]MBD8693579.1 M23 family metallopeptidase [Rhizobium sp. CFBP 13717]